MSQNGFFTYMPWALATSFDVISSFNPISRMVISPLCKVDWTVSDTKDFMSWEDAGRTEVYLCEAPKVLDWSLLISDSDQDFYGWIVKGREL